MGNPSVYNNPAARFVIVAVPPLSPGHCFSCTRNVCEDGFVDGQIFIDYVGGIYFCADCVREMAALFGLVDATQLEAKYAAALAELDQLQSSVENLESQVDTLSYERLRSRGMLSISDIPSDSSSDIEDAQVTPESVSDDSGSVNELIESTQSLLDVDVESGSVEESDVTESVDEQGPDDDGEPASSNELAGLGI